VAGRSDPVDTAGVPGGVNFVLVRALPGGKGEGSVSMTRGAGREVCGIEVFLEGGACEDCEFAEFVRERPEAPAETFRTIRPLLVDEPRERENCRGKSSELTSAGGIDSGSARGVVGSAGWGLAVSDNLTFSGVMVSSLERGDEAPGTSIVDDEAEALTAWM